MKRVHPVGRSLKGFTSGQSDRKAGFAAVFCVMLTHPDHDFGTREGQIKGARTVVALGAEGNAFEVAKIRTRDAAGILRGQLRPVAWDHRFDVRRDEGEQTLEGAAVVRQVVHEGDFAGGEIIPDQKPAFDADGHAVRAVAGNERRLDIEVADVEPASIVEPPQIIRPYIAPRPLDVPLGIELMSFRHGFARKFAAFGDGSGQHRAGVGRNAREHSVAHHVIPVAVGDGDRLHGCSLGDEPGKIVELPREISGVDHQTALAAADDGARHLPDTARHHIHAGLSHGLSCFPNGLIFTGAA